jgi:hypothetical protein
MQYARASVAAIAAVMALSPTYAAPPKPIVDLSRSPALSDQQTTPQTPAKKPSNGLNQQTMELGGGALVILVLGGVALAASRGRRKREEESWYVDEPAEPVTQAEPEPMTLSQPVAGEQPAMVAPPMSSFEEPRRETAADSKDCEDLETWTERAKCGPTPENPSQSLKKRMKRAAFFEKRDREVAAGEAAPVDADAGLPENLDETA